MKKLDQHKNKGFIFVTILLLLCFALWQLASASWVHTKAILAQQLLNHSWSATLNDSAHSKHKPWPWADTWPVAKLSVPQFDIEQIVLAGDSGSSLAFAPGYSMASALPNTVGTTVISAHRDTHFAFLKNLKVNDALHLQTDKKIIKYQIYDFKIVNSNEYHLPLDDINQTLVLATCYPFDALSPGGPLRYLVFAKPS